MKFESEDLAICVTCGTQYDTPYSSPPKSCRICDDPRQYVPPGGQQWSSLAREQPKQKNIFTQDETDDRIWFIHTESASYDPLNPSFAKEKQLGIGERAILLLTPHGNILWDLIALIDESTVSTIQSKGGLAAIVISHPHFYTTHLEWAKQFNCPVYISKSDSEWLNREDKEGRRKLVEKGTEEVVEGVTMIRVGGHFDGSAVLHWENKVFHADSFMVVPSAYYHKDRLPGTSSYSFMWSYPNMIPLAPEQVHNIWKALKPFEFEATYGGFMGQNNRRKDLKEQLLESMKIFVGTAGHKDAAILQESL